MLIAHCRLEIVETEVDGWIPELVREAVVHARVPLDRGLTALPQHDRKRIAEAIVCGEPAEPAPEDIRVVTLAGPALEGPAAMLAELIIHRAMMESVSTGGERIQEVDDYYRAREARLRERLPESVEYQNPHENLWDWYHHWSANFPQWRERRQYVRELFGPAIAAIAKRSTLPTFEREPTGWERVDRVLAKARAQLEMASAEEDFQAIGLLCREATISLAQEVFDPALHPTLDGVAASQTDANRMLEAYIGHTFPGASYKEVRAHARASLALALNLQHRRTATRQLAALCIEATASTTAVVSIIARPTHGAPDPRDADDRTPR